MTDLNNLTPSQPTEETPKTSAQRSSPAQLSTLERQRGGSGRRADVFLLLLGVLLVGAYFRFLNVDWDEGEHLHPDERYMTMVTGTIRSPLSAGSSQNAPAGCISWGGYFDSYCSPLNPYNYRGYGSYAYGTFPLFSTRIVGEWLNGACMDPRNADATPSSLPGSILRSSKKWIAGLLFNDAEGCVGDRFTDYGHIHLLGRMLSALVDLGAVLFTFLIGRRLYSSWVGLLGAALYALAALPIQQSHFYTVDAFAGFFITAAGYFAVRAAQHGRWRDYILAGLIFGLALASKVSVWPFAAVIALAALLYYVRSWRVPQTLFPPLGTPNQNSSSSPSSTPERTQDGANQVLDWLMVILAVILCFLVAAIALLGIWSAVKIAFFFAIALLFVGGVVFYAVRPGAARVPPKGIDRTPISVDGTLLRLLLAGVFAFLAFRAAQPYAFVGTNFHVERWQAPEYDWLRGNVPDIWYTLNDKLPGPIRAVFLPDPRFISTLGSVNKQLTGEADVPWGHQWTNRLPFVFPWTNMIIWGMGLPLGLIVSAGWVLAGWELWRGVRRPQHFIPWAWATILFFYQGTQWVKSIRYLLSIYPFLMLLGAWLVTRLWQRAEATLRSARASRLRSIAYRLPLIIVLVATSLWAWGFSRIYTQPVTRNTASRWMVENIPTAATLHFEVNGEIDNQFLRLPPTHTYTGTGIPQLSPFVLQQDATITGITFTHLSDPERDPTPESFRVTLAADANSQTVLARSERTINLENTQQHLGDAHRFDLGPVQVRGGQEYYLITQAAGGGPIRLDTTVIANEYPDDSLPTRVDGHDPFAWMYRGLMSSGDGKTHWDLNEDPNKLSQALDWLDEADIIALSSNRGYASIPRLTSRYPLAIEFYRALFAEELGFDLIATFASYPTIGPFQFPDQETPFKPGEPSLIKDELGDISIELLPAEEAFSVYDHPQVFLFGKTDQYSRQRVEEILGSANLSQMVWMKPTRATLAPTALMQTEKESDIQRSGGTWSEIFDANGWLNRSPLLSLVVWWLLIQLLGWLAFPLLFAALPGLCDRGFPLAKTLGLLLPAALVWLASSTHLLPYSRPSILGTVLLLAAVGGALAWRQRRELVAWIARERRTILVSELLFSAMFLAFLLIRFGNPDLWHPVMGGERPMDLAYLNAVIKSTHFPPYDPWFAGGYLNYYYFGLVIVGTPIKLLGILPEIAYNLALPTFFALTAAGAFSIAFNVVASGKEREQAGGQADQPPDRSAGQPAGIPQHALRRKKYAIYAGLIAALFVAVMGNLGEIQLVADGLQELGSRDFEFQSTIPGLEPLVVSLRGLVKHTLGREAMPWRPEWPYWNASRAIPHPEGEAPPITEFPFFTFLYSDLHAHLLVLPLTLLALAFLLNWAFDPGFWRLRVPDPAQRRRRWFAAALGLVIGGAVIGSLRPTNTWEYVTYLAFAPLALAIGHVTHHSDARGLRLDLRSARNAVAAVGGRFIVLATLSYIFFLPYINHFATASTGFELWKGSKTPLWAYFGIHGLFLFPIITWLVLRRSRPFTGKSRPWAQTRSRSAQTDAGSFPFLQVSAALISILAAALFASASGYQVALIVLPFGFLALLIVIGRNVQPAGRLIALMSGVGLLLTLWVELAVLNTGDVGRMNTVFKFYLQAWILFGISAAVCIVWIRREFRKSMDPTTPPNGSTPHSRAGIDANPGATRTNNTGSLNAQATKHGPLGVVWRVWVAILVVLVALAALYPILATQAKINDRWARELGPGLDGLEWMRAVTDTQFGPGAPDGYSYPLRWDYEALMWLRENIQGSPVVVEGAKAPPYRSLRGRVATYTGLPIVIGYSWHQKQQRSFLTTDLIGQRERDVNKLYDTPDPWTAQEVLNRYDVSLVYVGDLERIHYAPAGIDKFDRMAEMGLLNPVFSNQGVTIYTVVR